MVSQTFLGIYFWGVYVWFVAGVLIIGIPAIIQVGKMLSKK